MKDLYIPEFHTGSEIVELYWLAGMMSDQNNAWFVRTVLRGVNSGFFHMKLLPVGMLPILTLGHYFAEGKLLSFPTKGSIGCECIKDVSVFEEITSDEIPAKLYTFPGKRGGIQRLFRYRSGDLEIYIPAIELIRYLFLHNKTLANTLMRPSALMLLFSPQLPGYYPELVLNFTAEMPRSSLSSQFAQEFCWLALDQNARKSWDSVYILSRGHDYMTFTPPPLSNSVWHFRGLQHENKWFVLELLHLSGRMQPCDKLFYGHPALKKTILSTNTIDDYLPGEDALPKEDAKPYEDVTYNYKFDDGKNGSTQDQGQKSVDNMLKQSSFDKKITIEKILIKTEKEIDLERDSPPARSKEKIKKTKTVYVSAAEQSLIAELPPIEFKLLTSAIWDQVGDLEALVKVAKQLAYRFPERRFAMSFCQLKEGRVFSMANRMPRQAVIVSIYAENAPPIFLLDVDRTGDIALSLIALRFQHILPFEQLESSIKQVLDGLVDASGHWDSQVEQTLIHNCLCERFPKLLTPRKNINKEGQAEIWAMKLANKLKLSPNYCNNN